MDDCDKAILKLCQGDLPLETTPFTTWAAELGIGTEELLSRIRALKQAGIIRDFKAVLRHRKAGITANAMVVWEVEPERCEEVGRLLAAESSVTHCYERPGFAAGTIFSMIHDRSAPELTALVARIAASIRVDRYQIFWSTRELKKSSMQYFI